MRAPSCGKRAASSVTASLHPRKHHREPPSGLLRRRDKFCSRSPSSFRCRKSGFLSRATDYDGTKDEVVALSAKDEVLNQLPWRWEQSNNALQTYILFFSLLLLGQVPVLRSIKYCELPYFVGLACLTIYIGAHRGLTNKMKQQITFKQGALAPLAASAALFGGFLLVKYLPWINLQTVFNLYFWLVGSAAVTGALAPPLRQAAVDVADKEISVPLPEGLLLDNSGNSIRNFDITPTDIFALCVGLAAASLDLLGNHQNFTFNNLVACLICCDILQLIGLRSFRAAAVLLFGLLAYDVFWVFASPSVIGENVMLTVATSDVLVGPTKILFPRYVGSIGEAASYPFSLLGLGDIAVPGLLACLALRFDSAKLLEQKQVNDSAMAAATAFQASLEASPPEESRRVSARAAADAASEEYDRVADSAEAGSSGQSAAPDAIVDILKNRPYFVATMTSYVVGLLMAFGINAVTHLGQPALLYLVPCCFGGIVTVAAVQGDIKKVFGFTDTPSESLLARLSEKKAEDS